MATAVGGDVAVGEGRAVLVTGRLVGDDAATRATEVGFAGEGEDPVTGADFAPAQPLMAASTTTTAKADRRVVMTLGDTLIVALPWPSGACMQAPFGDQLATALRTVSSGPVA